jgi:hypothetical protein
LHHAFRRGATPTEEDFMNCEHDSCHCQSEVGMEKDGRSYCSVSCANHAANEQDNCGCGHAGCSTAEELRASA